MSSTYSFLHLKYAQLAIRSLQCTDITTKKDIQQKRATLWKEIENHEDYQDLAYTSKSKIVWLKIRSAKRFRTTIEAAQARALARRQLPPRATKKLRRSYDFDEHDWLLQDDVESLYDDEEIIRNNDQEPEDRDAPGGTLTETEDESDRASMQSFIAEDDEEVVRKDDSQEESSAKESTENESEDDEFEEDMSEEESSGAAAYAKH